jgi:hypothetical protein
MRRIARRCQFYAESERRKQLMTRKVKTQLFIKKNNKNKKNT